MAILDITLPIAPDMPTYPGEAPPTFERTASPTAGDPYAASRIALSAHAGTHLDAPAHFVRGAATVDAIPLAVLCGPAAVVDLRALGDGRITAERLAARVGPRAPARLILLTDNTARGLLRLRDYAREYSALTPDAAQWLVAHGVRLVGVDYLSVEPEPEAAAPPAGAYPVHARLLGAGIPLLEGLALDGVEPGAYDLVCLPLRLRGLEAAPVRACLVTSDARPG